MLAEHARADGMKRAAPERRQFLSEQAGDAPHHFAGGLVREREQQDAVGGNALFEQVGDAVGERAGLARTGAGNDEGRAGRRGDGGELLWIEFARVVNLQMNCGMKRFENVIARHGASFKRQTAGGKRKKRKKFPARRTKVENPSLPS